MPLDAVLTAVYAAAVRARMRIVHVLPSAPILVVCNAMFVYGWTHDQ